MPGLYIQIYIDLAFWAVLLSFSKRTAPTSLQLEKKIPGAVCLLGQEAAILLEKDKRTAQITRSIYIYIYRPGILGSPFILLSFSKRTIPISLQIEKEIPGAEGLLGLEAAILSEKDKRTALNAIYIDLAFRAVLLSFSKRIAASRPNRPSSPGISFSI